MSAAAGVNYIGSYLSYFDNDGNDRKIEKCVTVLRSGSWMLLNIGDCGHL